jgi:soluble lytic murein transglycosylase-like protein
LKLAALLVVLALQQGDTSRSTPSKGPARVPTKGPTAVPAVSTASPAAPSAVARAQARREANKAEHQYDDTFRRYSKRYFGAGFDWRWFKAQGLAESNLDPTATSRAGARGVMQLMPSTFGIIQSARPEFLSIDDPEWNIAAGIMHDRHLWKLWGPRVPPEDRLRFTFGSYNAGEGMIGRAADSARIVAGGTPAWLHVEEVAPRVPRWRYRETLGYVRRIDANYERLRRTR